MNQGKTSAGELMTSPVITVRNTDSVQGVARLFIESGIGCALVLDAEDREVGVITKTDMTRYDRENAGVHNMVAEGPSLVTAGTREAFGQKSGYHLDDEDESIENWITPAVYSVQTDSTLAEVQRMMIEKKVHHVFVRGPASNKIVGVITSMDMVRAAILPGTEAEDRGASDMGRVVELSHHEFYMIEPRTLRYITANECALRNLGYTIDELRRLTPIEVDDGASAGTMEPMLKSLAKVKGARRVFDAFHRRKDGTLYPVEVQASTLEVKGETVLIEVVEDLSDKRRREDELRRLSTAIEQSDESVVITDRQGTIQFVNRVFEAATGYTKAEMLGKNPRFLKSGKHPESFYKRLWDTILDGRTWKGIIVNKRKDGSLIYEESTISPVRGPEGAIENFVAIKRDITASMDLQERMLQGEKLAALGQLSAGIAHEVMAPISVVLGMAQSVERMEGIPDNAKEYLGLISKNARRAADIIKAMLSTSRRSGTAPRAADLREIVSGTVPLIKHELIRNGVRLRLDCGPAQAVSKVDAEQIREVLINLVLNAVQAMEDAKKKELVVQVERGEAINKIMVTDTGCGVPEGKADKIFEPFFTTKPVGKGTGLGLSICHQIAMAHSGFLSASRGAEGGTVFTLELPAFEPRRRSRKHSRR